MLAAVPFIWSTFIARASAAAAAAAAATAAAATPPTTPSFLAEFESDAHTQSEAAHALAGALLDEPARAQAGAATAATAAASADAIVREVTRGVLGSDVGPEEPLMSAGLDSLGAVELRNSLEVSWEGGREGRGCLRACLRCSSVVAWRGSAGRCASCLLQLELCVCLWCQGGAGLVWEELGGRGGECHGLPMHLAPPRPKARAAVLRKGAQQVEAGISRGSLCACHFILTDFMLTGTHTFCHALAVTPFHGPSTHPHL